MPERPYKAQQVVVYDVRSWAVQAVDEAQAEVLALRSQLEQLRPAA